MEDGAACLGVPAERVRTLEEAIAMPHLAVREFFHAFGAVGRTDEIIDTLYQSGVVA